MSGIQPCDRCEGNVFGMVPYGPLPGNTPYSFNDLESGTEYYFCDTCLMEWVDEQWYNEVVKGE